MFDNTVCRISLLVYTSAGIEINTKTNKVAKAYFCSLVIASTGQKIFEEQEIRHDAQGEKRRSDGDGRRPFVQDGV